MTPVQTEQTQFIVPPPTPLPTRSTTVVPTTSAAGAGIIPDSSILPGGILAAPSPPSAHNQPIPKLTSDALSPSDRFILDEVIRHVQTPHSSPLSQPDLSQPMVLDGYHYKRISPHKCPKSVKPFLRSARTQFRITGIYLVTPNDTTLDPTYCYRFYDLHAYPHAPPCLDDYEHEPCQQVLDDANHIFASPVSAAQRRANKVGTRGVTDKAMEYAQAMAHPEAPGLKAALVDELKSLSPNEHNTWEAFLGKKKDIPKDRVISSKAIFSIVYNPDGTFKKYKLTLLLVVICSSQNRKILIQVQSHHKRHASYSVL